MRIVILSGGMDSERDISIESGNYIDSLIKENNLGESLHLILPREKIIEYIIQNLKQDDIVINVMHGKFGEGGSLDSIINTLGYKSIEDGGYIAIDKKLTLDIASNILSIPVLETLLLSSDEYNNMDIEYPHIIKPNFDGSSYDIEIIRKKTFLNRKDQFLVSKFIEDATDISVPIVNDEAKVPVKIVHCDEYFSSKAKHEKFSCEVFNEETNVKEYALSIARYINCNKVARLDFIYKDGDLYFLEINNKPGMTSNSIIFQALDLINIPRVELVKYMIDALKK